MSFESKLWMADAEIIDHVPQALRIQVTDGPGTDKFASNPDQGMVLTPVSWATERA